jgi:hypothetical protein
MQNRMRVVLAVAVLGGIAAFLAAAQVPEQAAEAAATPWIALVDAGKYGQSWDAAASAFQQAVSRSQWEEAVRKARTPFGKVLSRKLASAKFTKDLPGVPTGDYVVLQYETRYENKAGAVETISVMKDKDGAWKVAGYLIK